MNNICNSFETQMIYKLLLYKSNKKNDIIKLIFVGQRKDNIKDILEELLENKLTSSKSKILNKEIPFYHKVFGDIIPNKTVFIYDFITENDCIYHIQENICFHLNNILKIKTLPKDMYIWFKSKNIKLDLYLNYLNQIFIDRKELENKVFIERIENILMMNKNEILESLVFYLPKKYKSIKDINFLDKETFEYNSLINSEELINLFGNSFMSLTNESNIFFENKIIKFTKYENPLISIKKKYKLDMKYVSNSEFVRFKILSDVSKIENNELYFILSNDFNDILDKDFIKYYFPLKNNSQYKELESINYIKDSYYVRETNDFIIPNDFQNKFKKLIVNNECKIKSLIFKCNSDLFYNTISDEQMLYLFKFIKTYYDLPIIKLHYNERQKIIHKFNKPFIQENGKEVILNIMSKKEHNITNENELSYICFKYYLSDKDTISNNAFNCYYFSNNTMIVIFNFQNEISVNKIKKYIDGINTLIKNIKKKLLIKNLYEIDINNLFGLKSISIPKSKILIMNKIIDYEFKNVNSINMYEKCLEYLSSFNKYLSFKSKPIYPNINLFYKSITNFFNNNNIFRFINNKVKHNIVLNKETKSKLSRLLINNFLIDEDKTNAYIEYFLKYKKLIKETNEIDLLSIKMNFKENHCRVFIYNIKDYSNFKFVLTYINLLFYIIFNEDKYNEIVYVNEKAKKMSKKKQSSRKKSSKKMKFDESDLNDLNNMNDFDINFDDLSDFNNLSSNNSTSSVSSSSSKSSRKSSKKKSSNKLSLSKLLISSFVTI